MRTIRKKASVIRLKYTPSAGWLDINFGGEIFRLLKGEVMLDKTPYSDETLVPIENLAIEGDIFSPFGKIPAARGLLYPRPGPSCGQTEGPPHTAG